jgi:hypothetical protein
LGGFFVVGGGGDSIRPKGGESRIKSQIERFYTTEARWKQEEKSNRTVLYARSEVEVRGKVK